MAATDTKVEPIVWRVHPARERIGAAVFAAVIIAAMIWLTAEIMENPWWGLLPAGFFLVTLQRFLFPSEFRIDEAGVSANSAFSTSSIRWNEIRCFQHDQRGAFLSSRRRPSMFDGFQGLHLVFAGNRDEVVARINAGIRPAS